MEYFAVGFVERVVRDVPFGGRGIGRPGAAVDGVVGEDFYEFHGGVGACFGVPVAVVDVGRLGGVGHFWVEWIGDGVYLGVMWYGSGAIKDFWDTRWMCLVCFGV